MFVRYPMISVRINGEGTVGNFSTPYDLIPMGHDIKTRSHTYSAPFWAHKNSEAAGLVVHGPWQLNSQCALAKLLNEVLHNILD